MEKKGLLILTFIQIQVNLDFYFYFLHFHMNDNNLQGWGVNFVWLLKWDMLEQV